MKVKIQGTWKDIIPKVKVQNQWRECQKVYTKVQGTWKEIYSSI